MKYMIMMNTPRDGYAQFMSWPKEILEAHFAFMEAFGQKLTASGELVSAEGLASPVQAKAVRAGKDGKPVTDGSFRSPKSSSRATGLWTSTARSARVRSPRRFWTRRMAPSRLAVRPSRW
jgi:hypothetical protein